jgi:threonine/homoserine/homoserine lactone efflux protein
MGVLLLPDVACQPTRRYLKAKQLFDRCAAGVMAALGLRLLLSPR